MPELGDARAQISPELCLVDPELAAWARLRDAPGPRFVRPASQQSVMVSRRRWRVGARVVVLGAIVLGVLTVTARHVSSAHGHKHAAARVELVWHPVDGARGYDVILWRDGKRVLDLWPMSPHVTIPASWRYRGSTMTPETGRILWFVYPVLTRSPKVAFGPLLAHGHLGT